MGAIERMPVFVATKIGRYFRTTIPRELLGIKENDESSGSLRIVR